MLVTEKGQVTIPKHIRRAAGVAPGSEVSFSLEGNGIVITPVERAYEERPPCRSCRRSAARVRSSLSPEFKQLDSDEIMHFLRGDEPAPASVCSDIDTVRTTTAVQDLVDNIWFDCIDETSGWHDWAVDQLQTCSERSPLHINLIIYTELLVPGPTIATLDEFLDVYDTLRSYLPWACRWRSPRPRSTGSGVAQNRFQCPTSYIGAHAAGRRTSSRAHPRSGPLSRLLSPSRYRCALNCPRRPLGAQ